jgi:hypothetical protein
MVIPQPAGANAAEDEVTVIYTASTIGDHHTAEITKKYHNVLMADTIE